MAAPEMGAWGGYTQTELAGVARHGGMSAPPGPGDRGQGGDAGVRGREEGCWEGSLVVGHQRF